MRILRFVPALVLALFGVVVGAGPSGAAVPNDGSPPYVCSGGGVLAPGTYRSVLVTGFCFAPTGPITIEGNLTLAPNSGFDDATGAPTFEGCPAEIDIRGNVFVGNGSILGLGSGQTLGCPTFSGQVGGSVIGLATLGVIIHGETIGGSVTIAGGGGGVNCNMPSLFSQDPALAGTPAFSDLEDSTVGGDFTVWGLHSCWYGALRDQIGGSSYIIGNIMADPDAAEVSDNVIYGNFICLANNPTIQYGDNAAGLTGPPNEVGGLALGQCGFGVLSPDPDGGPLEPISVPLS
ncbi:MAG TPA: hypothetical protein VEI83_16895 [Acidimicrobiales bacterium]|nr:hypothetical protein [Acidimicrobiales bacterium]